MLPWENLHLGELNTRMTNWFRIAFTLFTRFPLIVSTPSWTDEKRHPSQSTGRPIYHRNKWFFFVYMTLQGDFTPQWNSAPRCNNCRDLAPGWLIPIWKSKQKQPTNKHKEKTKTRRNVWSYRFFHLYLVYFNSTKLVLELGVEEENIAIINIPALERDK